MMRQSFNRHEDQVYCVALFKWPFSRLQGIRAFLVPKTTPTSYAQIRRTEQTPTVQGAIISVALKEYNKMHS